MSEYFKASLLTINNIRLSLLILGWVKKQQQLKIIKSYQIFPYCILDIIGMYWWCSNLDWFETVWCRGEVYINQQDRYIKNQDDKEIYFKFKRYIKTNDIWIYKFKVQHMDKSICIGVCDNSWKFNRSWYAANVTGYGISITDSNTGGYCITYVKLGIMIGNQYEYIPKNILSECGTEMSINVIINRKAKFVKFFVNGMDLGIAFFIGNKHNSIESFSIAVSMSGKDQSIKLCENQEINFDDDVLKITQYERQIIAKHKTIWCRNEWIDYLQKKRKHHDVYDFSCRTKS